MSTITRADAGASARSSARWRSFDPVLLFTTLALSGFGIFAVYVAGTADRQTYAVDQTVGLIAGLVFAVPLALVDYRVWKNRLWLLYGATIAMLLFVEVIGVTVNGAQSWVDIGPIQFQPSEFAKLLMVVVLAAYFADRSIADNGTFLRSLGLLAVPGLLVLVEPDLGTSLVFGAIFVAMTFIGGARLRQLGALAATAALGAFVAIRFGFLHGYQLDRLKVFINPQASGSLGYQVAQSKTAIGSGGLFGKGVDATTLANLGFLPEDHTDFIFANLAERIGFFGSLFLIGLFFLLIWRILHIATISRDRFGILISVGIGAIFLFHVLENIGMTMGLMPVTGIPLPFISYGRSNLVVSLLCLGLLQSVAMNSRREISKTPRV